MEEFDEEEIRTTERILNERFLAGTGYRAEILEIKIDANYLFNKTGEPENKAAYVATIILSTAGESLELEPHVFTNKTTSEDTAFHIARDIYGTYENDTSSQLWKNFTPEG